MSQPDDSEGGLSAEQVRAIFDERAAIFDLVEAIADEAHPERIEALFERYEEAVVVRAQLGLTDHQLGSSEPIQIEAMTGDRPVKALLIPADSWRPVQMIEISGRDDLRQHVGGLPEATRYDYDSIIYVSDTGRIDGQSMNTRATDYIRRESEAARQGKMIGIDPSYGLYGTAVVAGADEHGIRDVPDRLVDRFVSPEQEPLEASDAHRKANELLDNYFHAETLANTPGNDDRYPDVDTHSPHNAFQSHLRDHPELEALDTWKPYFQDMRVSENPREQPTPNRVDQATSHVRDVLRDRNEDGMIRFPWVKDRLGTEKRPSPDWEMKKVEGRTVYYRTQGEAAVWKDHGIWMMDYALDPQSPTIHADLGRTRSTDQALHWADMTIMNARVELHQSYKDVRTVVNLAKEVEDRTPQEQASLERLQEAIEQGPPPGALDPADDWLEVFEQETREREQDRHNDKGYGV
jgi:hypothetical protein